MSIEHYENFPVASWLCPAELRPAVTAIYHFARTADDLADEGDAPTALRQAQLRDYRQALDAALRDRNRAHDLPWQARIFAPLAEAVWRHGLDGRLLHDLLDAFEQDLVQSRYADRVSLLDYCRRSANPVGRLLLQLYGIKDAEALRRSDAICSALQLINFWQDMSRDGPRGRFYAPTVDQARHGVAEQELALCTDSPRARALAAELCDWARALMLQGAPLVHQIPGRAGWELRLVVQGGLRILEKIAAMEFATLTQRPIVGAQDLPLMCWRALRMRPTRADAQGVRA